MKKHEIRVTIDSTEKQQKALEILNRYNEPIYTSMKAMVFHSQKNDLIFDGKDCFIGSYKQDTEITLDELETILKNESK